MRRILTFIALLTAFLLPFSAQAADKLTIVTTTSQVADLVENVGGEHVQVSNLMGTGVDPHLYRPTRSDTVQLRNADLVFYNGLHLEGQMIELMDTLAKEKTVVSIAGSLPHDLLIMDEEQAHDPHVWMNVRAWIHGTDAVARALAEAVPAKKDIFAANARRYKGKLEALHAHIQETVATIPEEKRVLITAHDAFGYFGATYGVEVIGIQGLSTESEAGLKRMEEIADLLAERQIPAVFAETSVTDRNINALIEGTQARGHNVTLGGSLFSDAMGPEGTYEGTYIGMMEHNLKTVTKALGGTPSPLMLDNKLASAQTP